MLYCQCYYTVGPLTVERYRANITFSILLFPRYFLSSLSSAWHMVRDREQSSTWPPTHCPLCDFDSEWWALKSRKPLHLWVSSERGPCQMPSPLACGVEVHVCFYLCIITGRINQDSCGIRDDCTAEWLFCIIAFIFDAVRTHPEWLARGSCLLSEG